MFITLHIPTVFTMRAGSHTFKATIKGNSKIFDIFGKEKIDTKIPLRKCLNVLIIQQN